MVNRTLIIIAWLAVLAITTVYMVKGWMSIEGVEISSSGEKALVAGVILSFIVGSGLMALVFYSARSGHDVKADDPTGTKNSDEEGTNITQDNKASEPDNIDKGIIVWVLNKIFFWEKNEEISEEELKAKDEKQNEEKLNAEIITSLEEGLNSIIATDLKVEIKSIEGSCPVQAEGMIDGKEFYFRARHEHWSMNIGGDPTGVSEWEYEVEYSKEKDSAGYISENETKKLIYLAALKYKLDKKK